MTWREWKELIWKGAGYPTAQWTLFVNGGKQFPVDDKLQKVSLNLRDLYYANSGKNLFLRGKKVANCWSFVAKQFGCRR